MAAAIICNGDTTDPYFSSLKHGHGFWFVFGISGLSDVASPVVGALKGCPCPILWSSGESVSENDSVSDPVFRELRMAAMT